MAAGLLFGGGEGVIEEDLQALQLLHLLAEDLDVLLEVQAFPDAFADPDFGEISLGLGLGPGAGELDLRCRRSGLGVGGLGFLSIQGDTNSGQEERELVHGSGEGGFKIGKTQPWTTKKSLNPLFFNGLKRPVDDLG